MGLVFHMNDPTGHTAEWHGGDAWLNWKPLGVAAFRENILNRGALEMTLEDAMTSVRGPVTNFSGKGQVTFVWPSDLPIKVFGLVPRGWLPAAVCESTLLLPDANLAGAFSLLDDEASRLRARSGIQDVPLLALGTNLISPMLAALEAGQGRFPSREELADRAERISDRLRRGFPDRQLVVPSPEVVNAGFAIVEELRSAHDRDAAFLKQVYPLVAHRVDDADIERRHAEVNAIAERFEIRRRAFLYLLVVDCLYDDGPVKKAEQRPGRLVLKPKKVFTDSELFNGLCDVMNMELLCKTHMVCEAERPVLCTMDHGMAQAWAMFGPYDMRFEDGKPAFHIGMDDSFAIRMSPQRRHRFFSDLFSTDSS